MTYRLALLSPIPVIRSGAGYKTLDLWAVDLAGQLESTPDLTLICPVLSDAPTDWQGQSALPNAVRVVDAASLRSGPLGDVLAQCDVVQVFGGQGWRASRLGRRMVAEARRRGVKSVVGLSSNRARSALMNASIHRPGDLPRAARALISYVGLRASYWWLTARTDGTFIVGDGIRTLVSASCPCLHVGIASWVHARDIAKARARLTPGHDTAQTGERLSRLCIASRLEPMKGVHLGIEALSLLRVRGRAQGLSLTIFGAGSERERLGEHVKRSGISDQVAFGGTLPYPHPFLDRLQEHGIVVLPNLNDEQPRLVFDAISQGCLPLCPDTRAYAALGLPTALIYKVGDAGSMADALAVLCQLRGGLAALQEALFLIAERHTLESMHAERAAWIDHQVLRRGKVLLSVN